MKDKAIANDDVVSYVLIKRMLAPIVGSKAFKLGLIDLNGKILREPKTDAELSALTSLDRLVYKIRRLLGGKTNVLYEFIYSRSLSDAAYKNATFGISLQNRPEIKKVVASIKKSKLNESKDLLDRLDIAISQRLL